MARPGPVACSLPEPLPPLATLGGSASGRSCCYAISQRFPDVGLRDAELDAPLLESLGEGLQFARIGISVRMARGCPRGVPVRHPCSRTSASTLSSSLLGLACRGFPFLDGSSGTREFETLSLNRHRGETCKYEGRC
ncbi:hypothetical protein PUN28_012096 [Cardiocondyla obscurior]|uniref:Uncharacterized protein n=1 Tax=Cardiocondyla obscurior TaxID=286306 RepID=A0AAW2F9F7_9HYME